MKNIVKNITAGIIAVEGVCASIVVDDVLKTATCNKIAKHIGRGMIGTMIAGYTTAQVFKVLFDDTEEDDGKHTVVIDLPHRKNIKARYAPGELVTITAEGELEPFEDFMYWHATKGHVEFENEQDISTSFIMPDEKVRITFAIGTDINAKMEAEAEAWNNDHRDEPWNTTSEPANEVPENTTGSANTVPAV